MIPPVYGLMAEFETPSALLRATRRAYSEGYRRMDAYSPFPIHDLPQALGLKKDAVPAVTLTGGLLGGLTAYMLQYWISTIAYPVNVAGRPMHSWPAFIIVTFEMTVLFAGIAAFVGMLALNGLPMPYHPVFNVEEFEAASRDKFFLCIEANDPRFDLDMTRDFLQGLGPVRVVEVPH
ncbi:MAG: DUF3341 domain-containing protein [Terriglobales bacterium]